MYTDQIKPVGGITVGNVRYSIQTKGYTYGKVAVVQHVELCQNGHVLATQANTEAGRATLKLAVYDLFQSGLLSLPADAEWLLSLIEEVR